MPLEEGRLRAGLCQASHSASTQSGGGSENGGALGKRLGQRPPEAGPLRGWGWVVSPLRAALHPSPGPSSPPRWGCRARPHLPPTLMKGHQKASVSSCLPLPRLPPSPAFSAPIRNQTAWEKSGWEPAADSDLGTLPNLPSACPPRPAPSPPSPRKPRTSAGEGQGS